MSLPNDIIGEWELTRVETYETKDGKTELISTHDISDPYKTTSGTWESLKIDANVIECINYSIDDNGNHDSSSEHFTYSISGNKLTLVLPDFHAIIIQSKKSVKKKLSSI